MKGVISLLRSRKTWVTIFGIIGGWIGFQFGQPEQVQLLAGLCAVLVLAIMGEDIAKHLKVELPEDKDKQKDEVKALAEEVIKAYLEDKAKGDKDT